MAYPSGLAAQLGLAEEITYGTFVAPARFHEFISESLKFDRTRIDSKAIRAGRRVLHRWAMGTQKVQGDIELELAAQGFGMIFKHIFGGIATTGAGPYTHTFTPGTLAGKSLTLQVGKPDVGGVVRSHSYTGCKLTNAEIRAQIDEYAQMTLGVYGCHEDTAQSLGVATYPGTLSPFVFTSGSVTLAASAFDVREFTLSLENSLALDRFFVRATTPERPKEPLENGLMNVTGNLMADYIDLTAYNRFVAGTEAALVLSFNAGASAQLNITMNVRFDGETPVVESRDMLTQPLPFVAVSGTSDAAAITAVLINADSTP